MRVLFFIVAILSLNSCFKPYESKTYTYNQAKTINKITSTVVNKSDDDWEQAGAMLGMALVGPMLEEQLGGSYIKPTQNSLHINIKANGQGDIVPQYTKKDDAIIVYNENNGDSLVFNYDKEHDLFWMDFGDDMKVYFTKGK